MLSAMMADEGFGYAWFLDSDGSAADDDKFCIDLETVMSVLDEDTDHSEEAGDGGKEDGDDRGRVVGGCGGKVGDVAEEEAVDDGGEVE
ncbi:hypothetical protein LR48_Vigan02g128600 [Vigna angularis]|uniref:Uncharacterized protein n=1 Tax=Phaseolus angularis TaxID=3914 RepID=A0A0L9TXA4_PHAAN|nr:hypothetical protein LR48_Vigan02g128600 [Vigna angularis]